MVSGTGWEAVLGTDATMSTVFMMCGMFWGRAGKWAVTLLESSRYDGRGRPIADLATGYEVWVSTTWHWDSLGGIGVR